MPSLWRRALRGLALCSATAIAAPAKGDTFPRDPAPYLTIMPVTDGTTNDWRGRANTAINATAFKNQSLASAGGYQFLTYYHHDGRLVAGRRKKIPGGWSAWTLRKTAFTSYNIDDSHNVSTIGLDGSGTLHVCWGMHGGGPLLYTRSTGTVQNDRPFELYGASVGHAGRLTNQIPLQETTSITYPEFWNIPGSSDLLLSYRTGSAGNGDYHLARWLAASGAWVAVHASLANPYDPWIARDCAGDGRPNVNAYQNGLIFGPDGRIHVTWCWRTGADSTVGFADYQSNHNIQYAWSDDQGVTWRRQDGGVYERNGVHALDESNAQIVVSLPEGSSLINHSSAAAGPDGTYYLATWWAPGAAAGDHLRQYVLVWFDGAIWRTRPIARRLPEVVGTGGVSGRMSERQLGAYRMSRPVVAVDASNRVIVLFNDGQRGRGLVAAFSERPARDDWRFIDLVREDLGKWEPKFDQRRWREAGVLCLYLQAQGAFTAAPPRVVEWDARAYFAAANPPGAD